MGRGFLRAAALSAMALLVMAAGPKEGHSAYRRPDDGTVEVFVTDSPNDPFLEVTSPGVIKSAASNLLSVELVSSIHRRELRETHFILLSSFHKDKRLGWKAAHDEAGKKLRFKKFESKKVPCPDSMAREGNKLCSGYEENFAVIITSNTLRHFFSLRSGMRIILSAKDGPDEMIYLTPTQVVAHSLRFVETLHQAEANLKAGKPGGPPPPPGSGSKSAGDGI